MQNNECSHICDQFTDYQENTLTPAVRAEVDKHLSLCSACFDLFQDLSLVLKNLHSLPSMHTRSDFTSTLMEKIDGINKQSFWQKIYYSSYTRVAGYAIAAGLVVALGINMLIDPIVPRSPRGVQNFAIEQNSQIPGTSGLTQTGDSTVALQNDSLRVVPETINSENQPLQLVNGTK